MIWTSNIRGYMKTSIVEHLQHNMLVGDGAMGMMLYARGIPLGVSYDELNRSQPDLVRTIHEEYVAAGAGFIETNTFGANRMALAKHNLEDQVGQELEMEPVQVALVVLHSRKHGQGKCKRKSLLLVLYAEFEYVLMHVCM